MQDEVTQIATKQARSLCNCEQITVAEGWACEEFEDKMNISCPIHGPCRLGVIVSFTVYGDPSVLRLAELVREYRRRCLTYRKMGV